MTFNFRVKQMEKREIRRIVRGRIAALTEQQRAEASERIFAAVEQLPSFESAEVIALFASLQDEPRTEAFIAAWHGRKRIVLPRIEGEVMHFYDYSPEAMQSGSFGIAEPQGAQACDPADIDLMIVPGVAFTAEGWRLGRGKGFYDRYLSQEGFRATTVGVCCAEQIVDSLPHEPHDKRIEKVVRG